ncbi:MAG: tRNA guanosine(34) transglycosylase Tgt [Patescibacteria group bacterium]|nr:tRNA guanosine(34) transglycosylase Tgt [Patescibacteria group bacterium]
MFKIIKRSKISQARLGIIKTGHGSIKTPFFMPDATRGLVKNLSNQELINLGLECFVVNTLHLFLRPGVKLINRAGGLHKFVDWHKPILSDSGGYQIFSLIHKNKSGNPGGRITDNEAIFRSPLDGSKLRLTPEQSIKIQFGLGTDIIVCLDDCPPNGYNDFKLEIAVKRTIKWARKCRVEYDKQIKSRRLKGKKPLIIAVIQGGNNLALREFCARELLRIGFDGFGFGARHIDEQGAFLSKTLELTAKQIPDNKLRFGLGIGLPVDIVRAIKMGWDMFDCVIPTREGRHGRLLLWKTGHESSPANYKNQRLNFYETINITNAKFSKDFSPINAASGLTELKNYSKAYLNYLFKINESLAGRLASLNNLEFYLKMLSEIRGLIGKNMF